MCGSTRRNVFACATQAHVLGLDPTILPASRVASGARIDASDFAASSRVGRRAFSLGDLSAPCTALSAGVDRPHPHAMPAGNAAFFLQWGGRNENAVGRTLRGQVWNAMPTSTQAAQRASGGAPPRCSQNRRGPKEIIVRGSLRRAGGSIGKRISGRAEWAPSIAAAISPSCAQTLPINPSISFISIQFESVVQRRL
jgi:hypothetical protein